MVDRMPPLNPREMNEEQKKAAAELAAGPRGGVRGPFIPLLRSPELMSRLQKVGEYLRFQSSLPIPRAGPQLCIPTDDRSDLGGSALNGV